MKGIVLVLLILAACSAQPDLATRQQRFIEGNGFAPDPYGWYGGTALRFLRADIIGGKWYHTSITKANGDDWDIFSYDEREPIWYKRDSDLSRLIIDWSQNIAKLNRTDDSICARPLRTADTSRLAR